MENCADVILNAKAPNYWLQLRFNGVIPKHFNSNICETRLYLEFTATNRISGKTSGPRYLDLRLAKSAILVFFGFSNITVGIFMVE